MLSHPEERGQRGWGWASHVPDGISGAQAGWRASRVEMITFKIHGMTAEEPARLLLATSPLRRGTLAGLSSCKFRAAKARAPGFGVFSFLPSWPT